MIVGYSKKAQTKMALALILPALLIVSVFTYIPSAYVFFLSFKDWDMISPVKTNVGLKTTRGSSIRQMGLDTL